MPKTIDNPAQLKLDLFALQPASAIAELPAVSHPRSVPSRNLIKLADKLDKLATTMQKTIDAKLHPAIGQQNIMTIPPMLLPRAIVAVECQPI